MERIVCSCVKCDQRLGEFINLWIKIGKNHISPIVDNQENLDVISIGTARLGEEQTLIENCHLQDLACINCNTIVGLACLVTPVNHVLHDGQVFLRLSAVSTASERGDSVEVTIQRSLKLRETSRSGFTTTKTTPASESSAHMFTNSDDLSEIHGQLLDRLQTQLEAHREETQRINRAGFQMVSSFDSSVLHIEGEIKKLKDGATDLERGLNDHHYRADDIEDAISSLRNELNDVKKSTQDRTAYIILERQIASVKKSIADVHLSLINDINKSAKGQQQNNEAAMSNVDRIKHDMECIRKELSGSKETIRESISLANAYSTEVASLRAELKELREELAQERTRKSPPHEPVFPSKEIDILTTSITKIGQRAGQVEPLQMELELLKERVQRIETASIPNGQDAANMRAKHTNPVNYLPGSSRPKRKHSPRLDEPTSLGMSPVTPSNKRPIRGFRSSSPPKNHDPMSTPPSTRARNLDTQTPNSPRLTKSGTVDKRFLERGSRLTELRRRNSNG